MPARLHSLPFFVLVLALASFLVAGCAELSAARRGKLSDDALDRVAHVGGGTLVVRTWEPSMRVGLISLDVGSRHLLDLERMAEPAPGAFAGPDARGRYAYFTHNRALVRTPPSAVQVLLFGSRLQEEYEQSWRIQRNRHTDPFERWLFDPMPTDLLVGDLVHAGERTLVSRPPAEVLEKLLALAPASGELAYFSFDFDAEGVPQGLRLEIVDLDGGAPRSFALGRTYIEVTGEHGPDLAWLGDERHLICKRDAGHRNDGRVFALDGDWNGAGGQTDGAVSRLGVDAGTVLCAIDAQTGAMRDLGAGLWAWPTGRGDEVLASDGDSVWIVHAETGTVEGRRRIEHDSPLHAPWKARGTPHVGILGALGPDRILVQARAPERATVPREWASPLRARPTHFGLELVTLDGAEKRTVVPLLTFGSTAIANGTLPREMPWIRRSAKHTDD